MSDQIATTRSEIAERYVAQTLEHIDEQRLVIERLKAEDHLNLVKPAEDYLRVLMETLESAREHMKTVAEAASIQ
ncbi:MAG: hypothetical protein JO001_02605 [Alphaproteobacteria bacterium]|nr:hypothetical protein [Alphaproteobacteria bacterium]